MLTPPVTDALPPAAKPWSRLDGEPARWYHRFTLYCDLGPSRTLLTLYRAHTGSHGNVNDHWYRIARRWNWDARASAFDDDRRAIQQERDYARRWDLLEARMSTTVTLGGKLQRVIQDYLDTITPDDVRHNLPTLRALLRDMLDLQRIEMGLRPDPVGSGTVGEGITGDEMLRLRNNFFTFISSSQAADPTHRLPPADPALLIERARDTLAALFPTPADAFRFLDDVGIPRPTVGPDDSPAQLWHATVTVAVTQNKLAALVSLALRELPGNPALISLLRLPYAPTTQPD